MSLSNSTRSMVPTSPSLVTRSDDEDDHDSPIEYDALLKAFLLFSLHKFKVSDVRKAFDLKRGHGKIITPNKGVRGGCRDVYQRMSSVLKFISLPEKDQEKANKDYKDSTLKSEQAEHKSNLEYLSKIEAKISAIEAHPGGEEIARSVGFAIDSQEDTGQAQEGGQANVLEFSSKDKLRIYLEYNDKFDMHEFKRLFRTTRLTHKPPNAVIKCGHASYVEFIDALIAWSRTTLTEQANSNKKYKDDTTRRQMERDKKSVKKMITRNSKLRAIRQFPDGMNVAIEVANSINFRTDGINDVGSASDSEDEDEIVPHRGSASSAEDIRAFQTQRNDLRCDGRKTRKRVYLQDGSSKESDLGRTAHKRAFFTAATAVARANDALYLNQAENPSGILRTHVLISINKIKDKGASGGRMKKKKMVRDKTEITLLANDRETFKSVMDLLRNGLSRRNGSNPQNYDVLRIFRSNGDEDQSLLSVVKDQRLKFENSRKRPKNTILEEEEVLDGPDGILNSPAP